MVSSGYLIWVALSDPTVFASTGALWILLFLVAGMIDALFFHAPVKRRRRR